MPKKSKTKKQLEGRKKLEDHKYKVEVYLAKVDECIKKGGKSMDCKIEVRDEMRKAKKEKKPDAYGSVPVKKPKKK